jgi:hypothetical protein
LRNLSKEIIKLEWEKEQFWTVEDDARREQTGTLVLNDDTGNFINMEAAAEFIWTVSCVFAGQS